MVRNEEDKFSQRRKRGLESTINNIFCELLYKRDRLSHDAYGLHNKVPIERLRS